MKWQRASSIVAVGGTANNAAAILRSTHDIMYTYDTITQFSRAHPTTLDSSAEQ